MNYVYEQDNELYHYGVLGMKWGIRKGKKYLGSNDEEKVKKGTKLLDTHKKKITKKINRLDKSHARIKSKNLKGGVKLKKTLQEIKQVETRLRDLQSKKASLVTRGTNNLKKLKKNRKLRERFDQGLNSINTIYVEAGKKAMR